jgi:uncharacterized glyoxalase superfamily protein PhnB
MKINAHLSFDGTCEAAFNFYAGCLGVPITIMFPCAGSPRAAEP